MMQITAAVAAEHGLTVDDLRARCRTKPVFEARAEAMRRMRETGRYTYAQIGRFFQRDHATVLSAIRRASEPAKTCPCCGRPMRKGG